MKDNKNFWSRVWPDSDRLLRFTAREIGLNCFKWVQSDSSWLGELRFVFVVFGEDFDKARNTLWDLVNSNAIGDAISTRWRNFNLITSLRPGDVKLDDVNETKWRHLITGLINNFVSQESFSCFPHLCRQANEPTEKKKIS